jgi:hypothetical protein
VLIASDGGLAVLWHLGDGAELMVCANLHEERWSVPPEVSERTRSAARLLWESAVGCDASLQSGTISPWSVVVRIGDTRLEQRP